MRRMTAVTCLPLVALAVACGGGSGGEDPVPGNPKTNVELTFEPAAANPGPGTAALALEAASGDTVALRVSVTGADDVFAASLDVTFDPDRVDFVDWSAGDLLEGAGQKPFYLVTEQPGRVVIGVSLSGGGAGVDVGVARTLIRLSFRALEAGSSEVAFENSGLLDSGAVPQDIPGITWHGGALVAN